MRTRPAEPQSRGIGYLLKGSNGSIARELVVTERAVEKHVGRILQKLHIPPNDDHHRRALAVLAWLKAD